MQKYKHNLSSTDYQLIEQMKEKYTDTQILNLIKQYPDKPIRYISKIEPKEDNKPYWLDMEINKELLTKEELIPLLKEWKEFFDNENEYQEWCKKQLERIGVNIE